MPEDTNDNNTNNQTVTREAYDQLKSELEAERTKVQESIEAAALPLKERIASLEADLQARTDELDRQKALAEERGTGLASLTAQHEGAVAAYRELVLQSNPVLPADMVQGSTVDEVKASVDKATALVGQIQQGLATQQQTQQNSNNVPAGSPGRTPADLSAMTTREKINYGLDQSRKR
jgi:hypothetical protein